MRFDQGRLRSERRFDFAKAFAEQWIVGQGHCAHQDLRGSA
jgi:hypothetical protein